MSNDRFQDARKQHCKTGIGAGRLPISKVSPLEALALLRAFDGYTGHEPTAIALRLSPHVFVRPGELRRRMGTEVDTRPAGLVVHKAG